MRRFILVAVWLGLAMVFGSPAFADECSVETIVFRDGGEWPCPPEFRLPEWERAEWPERDPDRVALDIFTGGFGLRHGLGPRRPGWMLTYTQQGSNTETLRVDVGLAYRIPRRFLFSQFYGGGGIRYRAVDGSTAGYVVTGAEVWLFFWETGFTFDVPSERFFRHGVRLWF